MLKPIEKALNFALLQLDDLPELHELSGKIIEIHILPIQYSLYVTLHEQKIQLDDETHQTVVTKITGYPSTFLKFLLSHSEEIPRDIKVEGDIQYLMRMNKVMQKFDLDWEELLSKFIGDAPTHLLSKQVKSFTAWVKDSAQSFKVNTQEYLHDEAHIVPSNYELEEFRVHTAELRDHTERLMKRIEALENGA